jgi:phage shock protein E
MGLLNWLGLSSSSNEISDFISRNAVIIDVRTKEEFKDGHIKDSINIVLDTLEQNIDKIKKMNAPIIACCRSGARSGVASGILKKNGIECINGGGWQSLNSQI